MIVCVAVDDNLGMTFNKRRQSQDRVLRERLLELTQGRDLWMNSYSVQQFGSPLPCNIIEDNDFLDNAGSHDFCFVENMPLEKYQKQSMVEKLGLMNSSLSPGIASSKS